MLRTTGSSLSFLCADFYRIVSYCMLMTCHFIFTCCSQEVCKRAFRLSLHLVACMFSISCSFSSTNMCIKLMELLTVSSVRVVLYVKEDKNDEKLW